MKDLKIKAFNFSLIHSHVILSGFRWLQRIRIHSILINRACSVFYGSFWWVKNQSENIYTILAHPLPPSLFDTMIRPQLVWFNDSDPTLPSLAGSSGDSSAPQFIIGNRAVVLAYARDDRRDRDASSGDRNSGRNDSGRNDRDDRDKEKKSKSDWLCDAVRYCQSIPPIQLTF